MPQLIYFDVYGKAEPIRIMLNHAKVAYEDVRMTGNMWAEKKATVPAGQVPVWVTDDGKVYNQSHAILRALAIEHGYYGENFEERWAADMVLDTFEDLGASGVFKIWWAPEQTEEGIKALVAGVAKVNGIFEKHLASHPDWKYLAGNKLTIADFKVVAQTWAVARNDTKKHPAINDALRAQLDEYPLLTAYLNRVGEEFKEYLANRPKCTI